MKTTIKKLSFIGTLAIAMLLSPFSNFANSYITSSLSLENAENPSNQKPIYLTNSKYRMETLELNNRILAKKNIQPLGHISMILAERDYRTLRPHQNRQSQSHSWF